MPNPHHYALVVGINFYPGVSDLRCPVRDARAFEAWLRNEGGVPEDNIVMILGDKDADDALGAEPTRDKVDTGFRRIHQRVAATLDVDGSVWADSRLYVFLSGHGVAPTGEEIAFLMADAGSDAWPHIPCRRYVEYYLRSQYFHEVVVFADCCRNSKEIEVSAPPFAPRYKNMGTTNYVIGYATGDGTSAFEPQGDAAQAAHSYFTEVLLEALRGANTGQTGQAVTDQTVADYVNQVVPQRSSEQQAFIMRGTPNRIVFALGASAPPTFGVTIHPPGGFSGRLELWAGIKDKVEEWLAQGGPHETRLPAGLYEVRPQGGVDGAQFAGGGLFRVTEGGLHVRL